MKKLIAIAALVTTACATFAQGTVDFNNRNLGTANDYLVRFADTLAPVVGTKYVAQLYYGATVDSLTAVGAPALFRIETTTSPGTWSGGTRAIPSLDAVGKSTVLQVRVWDSTLAADWAAAQLSTYKGYRGESAPFSFTYIVSAPPATTDDDMIQFRGFQIAIPEPSTFALLGLGALGMMIFRRK